MRKISGNFPKVAKIDLIFTTCQYCSNFSSDHNIDLSEKMNEILSNVLIGSNQTPFHVCLFIMHPRFLITRWSFCPPRPTPPPCQGDGGWGPTRTWANLFHTFCRQHFALPATIKKRQACSCHFDLLTFCSFRRGRHCHQSPPNSPHTT